MQWTFFLKELSLDVIPGNLPGYTFVPLKPLSNQKWIRISENCSLSAVTCGFMLWRQWPKSLEFNTFPDKRRTISASQVVNQTCHSFNSG